MRNIIPDAIHTKRGVVRYWSDLKEVARRNRVNPTEAEEKIWKEVLSKKQTGFIFLRQKPLHRFIADFYCSELGLVVEIDGASHNKKQDTDRLRDKFLQCLGIKTIRFTNEEVLNDLNDIRQKLSPLLSKRG